MATIHTFSSTNSKFNFLVGLYYITLSYPWVSQSEIETLVTRVKYYIRGGIIRCRESGTPPVATLPAGCGTLALATLSVGWGTLPVAILPVGCGTRWHCPPKTGFDPGGLMPISLPLGPGPHNIEYLWVSRKETFGFFETWMLERGLNPRNPTMQEQAGSFNNCTRPPALYPS